MSGSVTNVSVEQLPVQLSGSGSVRSLHGSDEIVEVVVVPLEGGKSATSASNNHDKIKNPLKGFSSSALKIDKLNGDVIELERRNNSVLELARTLPLPPSTSTLYLQNNASANVSRSISESLSDNLDDSQAEGIRTASALAPVDGGFGAWSYVSLTSKSYEVFV